MNKSAVTSNINRLEGKGLIEREQDQVDRKGLSFEAFRKRGKRCYRKRKIRFINW
ncbi:helix-turn-helix domain-containing protein [Peribacillus frigoritolerans]|nr:helix-turn-helix domain-containing protein [Peribacillus frigoritolerans]